MIYISAKAFSITLPIYYRPVSDVVMHSNKMTGFIVADIVKNRY